MFEGLGKALGGIAPTLAGALGAAVGGPVGSALARNAAQIVGQALGLNSDDPEEIESALATATPEQLAAIRKVDAEFKVRMRELDLDETKIHAADRDSARRRQLASGDRMPGLIASAALLGFFGILGAMIFHPNLPEASSQPLLVMLGALGALVTQIGNYYFGSSASSAKKNEALERLAGGQK